MTVSSSSRLHSKLSEIIRRGRILTAPAQLAGYDADGLGYKTFRPDAVVIPADAEELVALMNNARSFDVPLTIRGAGTSLAGGPVAAQGGVIVHTSMLKSIRQIDRAGLWCEVESSVVLNQLDAALAPHGLFYPPDPSSGPVCTLGGNVAMNAGGAHCFRYGVTSNYVSGVEVVLLDGSVHQFGGPAAGRGGWREDWKRLMVGSEGTLGAFTRFWLRLLPRPEKAWTYRATFCDLISAERAIQALASHPSFPVAIELMDPRCVAMVENSPMAVGLPKDSFLIVTEIDGPTQLVDARAKSVAESLIACGATSVAYSDNELERKKLWKARKVAGGLAGQLSPDFLVQDAVIPKRALAEVLQLVYDEGDAAGLATMNVFHAGDGNLHPNFLFDSRKHGEVEKVEAISKRLMQRVVELGGTLSGEHGIGNDKTAYMPLMFDKTSLHLQLAVPRLFNAEHRLNPLKVFESRRFGKNTKEAPEPTQAAGQRRGLFEPFLDLIDGVLCCSASTTGREIHKLCAPHHLRFPLLFDLDSSLRDQVASSTHSPASSRFGSYCDNLVGMNWRLPSGKIVRIGERVVKSTTGYDYMKFLLHSSGRFGEPIDLVLRLRPDCGATRRYGISGDPQAVQGVAKELYESCWVHWFDAIDFACHRNECTLLIELNCGQDEVSVYESLLQSLTAPRQLVLNAENARPHQGTGLPDVVLKTTPDRAMELAEEIATEGSFACISLGICGVVHGFANTAESIERTGDFMQSYESELFKAGGDWRSRHIAPILPSGVEASWLAQLEAEFAAA